MTDMKHVYHFILCGGLWLSLAACAAPTATPTPTPVPPTNTVVPTRVAPTATYTATLVPRTVAPTATNPPQAAASDMILGMTWTRDGNQIVTTTGNKLQIYDAAHLDSFATVTLPHYEFRAEPGAYVRLAFRPDGKALAAATQNAVHVWSVNPP